jgi:transposase
MIWSNGGATRVYLLAGAIDMRKGFDGLYGLVREKLELDPLSGHLFVFCNRLRTRIKILVWDGSGLWVATKRLEKGRFGWPPCPEGATRLELSAEELTMLLGGIDLTRTRRKASWFRTGPAREAA